MTSFLTPIGVELIGQLSTLSQSPRLRLKPVSCNVGISKISCDYRISSIGRSCSGASRSRVPISRRETRQFLRYAVSPKQQGQELSTFEDQDEGLAEALAFVEEFRKACATPVERLLEVVDAMVAEFEAGLAEDGKDLKMLPAFVEALPSGDEKGCFYALDLGGTNFRVLRARFGGQKGLLSQDSHTYTIPEKLMLGENDELFDFIAGKLGHFVALEQELHSDAHRKRELGFTFSFPVQQHSIASGTLIHWSKGFKVKGTEGKDIVTVLRDAIRRKGLDLEVAALVNDTVGCLAEGRYRDKDVMMAVIFGTGTNACYVEKASAVPKWKGDPPASGEHVINTEWGNFNSPILPTTFADEDLDRESVNPGDHIFEKLMSGMYLGDIVRRVVLKMAQEGALFADYATGRMSEKRSLTTPDVSKIHADESASLDVAGEVLARAWGIPSTTLEERKVFLSVIEIVTHRGARLAAAGIAAVLKKIGRVGGVSSNGNGNGSAKSFGERTVIAMDGGLFTHYPQFRAYMLEAFEEIVGKEAASNVTINLSKDGSGIGAVLLAACHSKYHKSD
jgi:hexokinase